MKKRMLSLLLTMALLLSFAVAPAYAAETVENTTPVTEQCPCGCGKTLAQVSWKSWDGNPKEGHYYLDGNFTQADIATVLSDTTVVLDLRGYTITTAGASRLFLVNGYLHILDTVGGGRMMARGVAEEDGGIIMVEENESIGPAVYLHSGTLTPDEKAEKVAAGGLVYVGGGATFCMKGGLLLNGNTNSAYGGGCVGSKVTNSHIQILGGKIVGGTASKTGGNIYSTGKVTLENCEIIGGNAGTWGGNVQITGESATLDAKNVILANGVSRGTTTGNKYGGGNICIYSGAKATLENCEIYGGYAACAGGNVCLGRGTTTLKKCNIYGGSCGQLGENVYGALSTAKATLDGCTIDGGVYHGNSKLTLKGALQISGNGMALGSGTLTATGLTSGAEVYVTGDKTFTGTAAYFKAGTRTALAASGTSLTATLAVNGAKGYCPGCNAQVAWTAYGTGNHCYLTENVTGHSTVTVTAHYALDLAGFTLEAAGRAYTVEKTGDLLITDTIGLGTLAGSDLLSNGGKLTLVGGKYIYQGAANGLILNSGDLTVNYATLDATAFKNTDYNGGAISLTSGANAKLTMMGGAVFGGEANFGGGVYACEYNTVNITATQFLGGKGTSGGCFYALAATAAEKGTVTITGASFTGGEVTTNSGSIYIARYDARITDCYISGGKSDTYAGNLSTGVSTDVVYTNCIIKDGYAASNGGNIYGGGNSTDMTFRDCLILNGKAAGKGGNIYLGNGETAVYGGTVAYGKAASGGNISSGSDDKTGLTLGTTGEKVLLTGGTATTSGGNIYVYKITNLNDVHIQNGAAPTGADLHFYSSSVALTLGEEVTGNIYINATSGLLTKAVYGGPISQVTCNAKNAAFYMDGTYDNCGTVLKGSTLYVASASVVGKAGETWYVSNEEAVDACDENSFVKLYTDNALVLTKDLHADLNGHTVAVSGDYKLYGMDSSGDGYTQPAGSATGTSAATYDVTSAPNGNTYIAIVSGGTATYHRLNMKITGVSIRPSANGIYYTAKWYCDDTLKALVDTYGVVASTADMPGTDFATEAENRYTVFDKASFTSGAAKNGAVISGIMKDRTATENEKMGKTPIYAKAYLTFQGGTTLISTDNIRYSLYDVMRGLDKLITEKPDQYRKFTTAARTFYETWKDNGMGSWKLSKIPTPADDGIIDLLMIGNSYCVYYVEELSAIAQSMDVDMRICYVYYSGCPIEKHYTWWKEGQSNYHYYETYTDGKKFKGRDVSLEWCLAQREWDVITMNFGGTNMRTLTAQQHLDKVLGYSQELFSYFRDSFPEAELYMHQTWTFELGYEKYGTFFIDTVEQQMAYTDKVRQTTTGICLANNIGRINTGDAWELYRAACAEQGIENNLCARLGNNGNLGDKSHDGDIGGGQYLNALVWFEILTGKDCRDTTYIPTYTYGGQTYPMTAEMAEMLQDAAHKAVTEMLPTYPENQ